MECKKCAVGSFLFGSIFIRTTKYLFLPQLVYDEEDNENYAALIIKRDNPHILDLVSEFTNTIALLNEKPGQE